MDAKTSQFWDARMLYIYAMLGGLIDTTDGQISYRILYLTNQQWATEYCLRILAKLENEQLITSTEIHLDERKSVKNAIERTGVPPSPHFMMKDPEQIKAHWKGKINKLPTAKKLPSLLALMSGIPRYEDEDKHDCIKFKLTVNNRQWFKDKVTAYLQSYEREELFAPDMCDPALYTDQVTRLLQLLGPSQHERDIKLQSDSMNPFDPENSYRYLETTLSLVTKQVLQITYMDLYAHYVLSLPQIYMHYTLLSTEPVSHLMYPSVKPVTQLAEVQMRNRQLFLVLYGKQYALRPAFRTDSTIYNFMNYIFQHSDEKIGRGTLTTTEGFKTLGDLTEVVRKCGFDPQLKDIFFPGTTKQTVFFTPKQLITQEQADQLNAKFENRHEPPEIAD